VVSVVFVAPRIFVFAPANPRPRRVRSIRDIPAAAAFAIALAIADASWAIARRLGQQGRWTETDRFGGYSTGTNVRWSDQLVPTDASHWSFETDGPVGAGIADAFLGDDNEHRDQTYRGWPSWPSSKPENSSDTSKH
jgi:hypothetical protein